ncbi:hypothetical protein [Ahniella affigens]|nr:hypothetical protein [Ahniella affigens]
MAERKKRASTATPAAAFYLGQIHAFQVFEQLIRLHFASGALATTPQVAGLRGAVARGAQEAWSNAAEYVYGHQAETSASEPIPMVYFDIDREVPKIITVVRRGEVSHPIIVMPLIRTVELDRLSIQARIDITDPAHIAPAVRHEVLTACCADLRSATAVEGPQACRDRLEALSSFYGEALATFATGRPDWPAELAATVGYEITSILEAIRDDIGQLPKRASVEEWAALIQRFEHLKFEASESLNRENDRLLGSRDLKGVAVQVCLRSDPPSPPAVLLVRERGRLAKRTIPN